MFDSRRALTVDDREQRLGAVEQAIARLRAVQLEDLKVLDTAQVATGDGARSLSEWVAARLDVSLDTARSLVRRCGAPLLVLISVRVLSLVKFRLTGWKRCRRSP